MLRKSRETPGVVCSRRLSCCCGRWLDCADGYGWATVSATSLVLLASLLLIIAASLVSEAALLISRAVSPVFRVAWRPPLLVFRAVLRLPLLLSRSYRRGATADASREALAFPLFYAVIERPKKFVLKALQTQ